MFDEVTAKGRGKRAAHRGAWLAGSTALQAALVVGIVVASAAVARHAPLGDGPLVAVKLVRTAGPAPSSPRRPAPLPKPRADVPLSRPAVVPMRAPVQPVEPTPDAEEADDEGSSGSDEATSTPAGSAGGVTDGASSAGTALAAPVAFDGKMTRPVLLWRPPIEYTQEALDHEVEGTMVVQCVVRVDGSVHGCRVLKNLPFMASTVLASLERAKYVPVKLPDGQPVDALYNFEIRLTLPR